MYYTYYNVISNNENLNYSKNKVQFIKKRYALHIAYTMYFKKDPLFGTDNYISLFQFQPSISNDQGVIYDGMPMPLNSPVICPNFFFLLNA